MGVIGELKYKLYDAAKGQILNNLRLSLKLNPLRKHVYGFLTNLEDFYFFKASRVQNKIQYWESCLYNRNDGLLHLMEMLTAPPQDHGMLLCSTFPENLVPKRYLTSGATSDSYEAVYYSTHCRCKLFKSNEKNSFDTECEILELLMLQKEKVRRYVPKLLFSQFPLLVLDPVGKLLPIPLTPMTTDFVHGLVEAVEFIHTAGVIHGDIQPQNIVLAEPNDQPMLIDFGFSIKALSGRDFYTETFASERIRRKLKNNDTEFKVTFKDEMESVFKVCYQVRHNLPIQYLEKEVKWDQFILVSNAIQAQDYSLLKVAIISLLKLNKCAVVPGTTVIYGI